MNKLYYILVVLICTVGFAQTGVYTSFSTGEVSPDLHGRIDALKFYSGCRILENMFVWAQGPVEKRRGTYYVGETSKGVIFPAIPAVPAVPATYTITYISEVGVIWGIPFHFCKFEVLTLDVDGAARDVGGGIVGLPCEDHPFVEGQVIWLKGTTYYDLSHTLTSGTTSDELQFTDTFRAETFDSSETVVQYISLSSSAGRMDQDDDGNMYFGTSITDGNCITKITDYMTIDTTFFTPDTAFTGSACLGIKVSTNSDYLYVYTDGNRVWKFNLSDGSEVWSVSVNFSNRSGYEIDIDSSDNVYICQLAETLAKLAASDGAITEFTATKGVSGLAGVYAVHVNSDMDVVITGGWDYKLTNDVGLYNLAIRTLDNSDGTHIALGGTYLTGGVIWRTYVIGTGFITSYNGYIYVLCNRIVYKLDTDLDIIAQTATITYAIGLFVDLEGAVSREGRIIVVNQDYGIPQDDIFWFYDADLNYLAKVGGLYEPTLSSWGAYVGGAWLQGNVVYNGGPGIPGIPDIPEIVVFNDGILPIPTRLFSFEQPKGNAYVIEAGNEYMRFYKDVP